MDEARQLLKEAAGYRLNVPEFSALERAVRDEIKAQRLRIERVVLVEEHLGRARDALARGALSETERELDAALALSPHDADALALQATLRDRRARQPPPSIGRFTPAAVSVPMDTTAPSLSAAGDAEWALAHELSDSRALPDLTLQDAAVESSSRLPGDWQSTAIWGRSVH